MARAEHATSRRVAFDASVARIAATQHGVVSRAQAERIGATRGLINHRLASGRWERCTRAVFRIAGSPPSWRQGVLAACLTWGAGAVVSHRAAAYLWALPGFEPALIELTVPRGRVRDGDAIIHRNVITPREVTVIDSIPVTTPVRTLLDIGSVCERDRVEEALDDAVRRRLVSLARLRRELREPQRGRPGVAVLRALLDARSDGPAGDSVLETRLRRLLVRARLPKPAPQYRIRHAARMVAVVDFAYPEVKLAIEADGYRWHAGRARWQRDLDRRTALAALGWRVLHVTWNDIRERPDHVVAAIRRALRDHT